MSKPKLSFHISRIFCDKDGKIVLWQMPNLPLLSWFIFQIIAYSSSYALLHDVAGQLASAFLFVWAYLEVMQGVNYFRRALGLLVGALIVARFFR